MIDEIQLQCLTEDKLNQDYPNWSKEDSVGVELEVLSSEDWLFEIENSKAEFVLLGIAEDIGIKAGGGSKGARSNWFLFLQAFFQLPSHCLGNKKVLLLGHLEMKALLIESDWLTPDSQEDRARLDHLISSLDHYVENCIQQIIRSGKTPIIIGGGQNSALGIIRAISSFYDQLHVLNVDARPDLHPIDFRNNRNSFTYALKEGILDSYHLVGIDALKTSSYEREMLMQDNVYVWYQTCPENTGIVNWSNAVDSITTLNKRGGLHLEIDLSAFFSIDNPVGIYLQSVRNLLVQLLNKNKVMGLHISEGIISSFEEKSRELQKALYLVTDFIKTLDSNSK